jgi:hypothetical protein
MNQEDLSYLLDYFTSKPAGCIEEFVQTMNATSIPKKHLRGIFRDFFDLPLYERLMLESNETDLSNFIIECYENI